MIKRIVAIVFISGLLLTSCKEKKEVSEIEAITKNTTSTGVFGTYSGIIPCADCDGIDQKLSLSSDHTFILENVYTGKDDQNVFTEKGTFKIEKDTLILSIKDAPSKYKIGSGFIEQLDMEGNKIKSTLNYKLTKL